MSDDIPRPEVGYTDDPDDDTEYPLMFNMLEAALKVLKQAEGIDLGRSGLILTAIIAYQGDSGLRHAMLAEGFQAKDLARVLTQSAIDAQRIAKGRAPRFGPEDKPLHPLGWKGSV